MKTFNTTGVCIPEDNYMVNLSDRMEKIAVLIRNKKYFTINRARQYGKTTTLTALEEYLAPNYDVISLDFQDITDTLFANESEFTKGLAQVICDTTDSMDLPVPQNYYDEFKRLSSGKGLNLNDIFRIFDEWCKTNTKPIILIIDEVDTATNDQVFLDFLGKLRANYIKRQKNRRYKTFQSVILAGVTDVKHLKSKIRTEDEHRVNSPWNIAADFVIDMSLSAKGIQGMLDEYEADHETGMDTKARADQIRAYTNGYPYLVSRICEVIDTRMVPEKFDDPSSAWTEYGVDEAVKLILSETNALFDSLTGKLTNYPTLKKEIRNILMRGEVYAWLPYDPEQEQLRMYGFICNNHNTVAVANRMFEMLLYTHFIGENKKNENLKQLAAAQKNIFIDEDGQLNVPKIMEHFIRDQQIINKERDEKFLEEEGRERFLTYLSPIINGTGTFSIEEQTRDQTRMDVNIHYLGRRHIIEMKIWHGERYNKKGEEQILGYLSHFGLNVGYMLSFNFNENKKPGVERVQIDDKVLFEGIV